MNSHSQEYKDWKALEATAIKRLDAIPTPANMLFQVRAEGIFRSTIRLSVVKDENQYKALCFRWRRDIDAGMFNDPLTWLKHKFRDELHPTIETHLLLLNPEFINPFLESLYAIRLPLIAKPLIGLDGTSYDFIIDRGFHQKIHLSWWEDCPEWQPLPRLVRQLINYVDQQLDGHHPG